MVYKRMPWGWLLKFMMRVARMSREGKYMT